MNEGVESNAGTLELLPNEILSRCFFFTITDFDPGGHDKNIKNLRLVSKRCHNVASDFLIVSTRVYLASHSLKRLEYLSDHPIFSKSVKRVELNLSYYDSLLASDLSCFADACSTDLDSLVDRYAHFGGRKSTRDISTVFSAWNKVSSGEFSQVEANPKQRFLFDAHEEYRRRWGDQEEVKREEAHITKIRKALSKFTNLKSICIEDKARTRSGYGTFTRSTGRENEKNPEPSQKEKFKEHEVSSDNWKSPWDKWDFATSVDYMRFLSISKLNAYDLQFLFGDVVLMRMCLSPSRWKGGLTTAFKTKPPFEFLPQFFKALEGTPVRPVNFEIKITPPNDLRCLQLTDTEKESIHKVLEKSKNVACIIARWARKDSNAEDNSRPRSEMLALCSLTSALFCSWEIRSLYISFDEYPASNEKPLVSIGDILPLRPWRSLEEAKFRNIPMTVGGIENFVTVGSF